MTNTTTEDFTMPYTTKPHLNMLQVTYNNRKEKRTYSRDPTHFLYKLRNILDIS